MIEKAYGASLRGPSHKKMNVPNQDCFIVDNRQMYTLAVVCDGLGSKKFSHYASRLLCRVIKREIRRRFAHNNFSPYETIACIQNKFLKRLWPFSLKNADTTCLFSVVSAKSIFLFQVGDGMAAVRDEGITYADNTEKDFANETYSFGKSGRSNWRIKIIPKEEKNYKILLCTDGVADDLVPDMVPEFIDGIGAELLTQDHDNKVQMFEAIRIKKINRKRLDDLLVNWPNKFGTDDKTIVVIR